MPANRQSGPAQGPAEEETMERMRASLRATLRMAGACGLGLAALAIALPAGAADKPAAAHGKTIGLAVTQYPFALYKGADDCPDGMAKAAKELYLDSVSPAERVRLQKLENLKEFEQKAYHTPDGRDVCEVPDYPRPPQRTPQGKVSFGMNLDGTTDGHATPMTCKHDKFMGPDGQPVDNQHYRMTGCSSNYRGFPGEAGYLESLRNSGIKDGGTTILVEIKGVDDERNDDEVEVGVYNGTDPMVVDPTGTVMLPYASLSVTDNPKYRSVGKGHIKDGVLLTDPMEVHIRYDFGGAKREYNLRAARLKLELKGKAGAEGMLAGYLSVDDIDMTRGTKQESAEMVLYDCPTWAQAIKRYADGFPDANGNCTAMSTAFQISAIPAFIIHPDKEQTAEAPAAVQTR
jgi:hypothetical protein